MGITYNYTAQFATVMRERGSPGLGPPESQQPYFSGVQDTSPCWSSGVHLRHQVRIGPDGSWEYVSRYEVKWGSGSSFDEKNYWRISSSQFEPEPCSSQLGAPGIIAYITDKLHSTLDQVEKALIELVQRSLAIHAPEVVIDRPQ